MIPEAITKRDHQLAILQQEFLALSFEDISHGVLSKPHESNSSSRLFNMSNTQRILTHKSKQQSFSSLTKHLNIYQSHIQPQPLTSLLHIKKTDSSKQRKIVRPGSSFKKDTLLEIERSVAVKQAALDHSINEEIIGNSDEELNYFVPETNCIKYQLEKKQIGFGLSKPTTPLGASKNPAKHNGDSQYINPNEKSLGFARQQQQPNLTISESSHCRLKSKSQSQQQLKQGVIIQGQQQQKQDNLKIKQQQECKKQTQKINYSDISARNQFNNLNQPVSLAVCTFSKQQFASNNTRNAQFSVRPHSGSMISNFHATKSKIPQQARAIQQAFKEIPIPVKNPKHSTQSTLIRHLLASEKTNDNILTRNYDYSVQIKEKVSKIQKETKNQPQSSPSNYRDIESTIHEENQDEFKKYLQDNERSYSKSYKTAMEEQHRILKQQQQLSSQSNYLEKEIEQINHQATNPLLSSTLEIEEQQSNLSSNQQENYNSSQNQQKNVQRTIKFQQVPSSKPEIASSSSSIYFPPKQQKISQVIPFNLSDTLRSRRKQMASQISTDQMKKLLIHPELKDSFRQKKLPTKRPSSSRSQVTNGISFLQNSGSFRVTLAVDKQKENQKYQNNSTMQNWQMQSHEKKPRPKSAQEQLFKGLILTGQKNYLPAEKHMRPQTAQQFNRQKSIERNLNDSLKSWENSQIDEIDDPAEVGKKGRFSKTEIE